MGRFFKRCSDLGLLVTLSLAGVIETISAAHLELKARITICVYDHARLRTEMLAQAEKEASRIFRQAGVEVEWLDLPTSAEEASTNTDTLGQLGPTGFALKILPKSMAEHLQIGDPALGYSIPYRQGESACI